MVHTFATREEAAIFASAMRSDGYFADILDEGMGSIYGPLSIGGIRVIVSDERIESAANEAESNELSPPTAKPEGGEFLTILRMVVVAVIVLGLSVVAIMLLSAFSEDPGGLARWLIEALKYPLIVGLAFAIMGPLMGGFTRWLRGERNSRVTGWLRWVVVILLSLLLILAML